jgi:threonine aldolase
MANQIAIRCHTQVGDSILCNKNHHLFYYESASVGDLSKTSFYPIDNKSGRIDSDDISVETITKKLKANGLLVYPWISTCVRAVTHAGIQKADVETAAKIFLDIFSEH